MDDADFELYTRRQGGPAMIIRLSVIALGVAAALSGGDRRKVNIDPESEDGILLQRIQQEPTAPRKLALLEKFGGQFPKADAIAWVYEQLVPLYRDAQAYDKLFATVDKLLAVDPNDADAANDALRAAQAKADADLIDKYAQIAWDVGTRATQAPKPKDPDAVAEWKRETDFARDLVVYSEYVMHLQASQSSDPHRKEALLQALEKRNSQSKYLEKPGKPVITQMTFAMAEQGLMKDPDNEDMLMAVAQHYMQSETELARVLSYSLKVIELMRAKPRPENVTPADWEKKRAQYVGGANWMAGVIYSKEARYGFSDKYLRAALPYVRDNNHLLAAALFYLGYDNYALAGQSRDKSFAVEALKYSKMCAGLDSPFQSLARKSLEALRNEYNLE
jgi:hypothetical protein